MYAPHTTYHSFTKSGSGWFGAKQWTSLSYAPEPIPPTFQKNKPTITLPSIHEWYKPTESLDVHTRMAGGLRGIPDKTMPSLRNCSPSLPPSLTPSPVSAMSATNSFTLPRTQDHSYAHTTCTHFVQDTFGNASSSPRLGYLASPMINFESSTETSITDRMGVDSDVSIAMDDATDHHSSPYVLRPSSPLRPWSPIQQRSWGSDNAVADSMCIDGPLHADGTALSDVTVVNSRPASSQSFRLLPCTWPEPVAVEKTTEAALSDSPNKSLEKEPGHKRKKVSKPRAAPPPAPSTLRILKLRATGQHQVLRGLWPKFAYMSDPGCPGKSGKRFRCIWPYKRRVCEYEACKQAVKRHIELCHFRLRPFKCTFCEKAYGQKTALTVHIATHTGEKNLVCRWNCGARFSDPSRRYRHHVKAHQYKPRVVQKRKTSPKDDEEDDAMM